MELNCQQWSRVQRRLMDSLKTETKDEERYLISCAIVALMETASHRLTEHFGTRFDDYLQTVLKRTER